MKYIFTLFILVFSTVLMAQDVIMQNMTVSQCGGVFYDSGGEFGNYGNDENFVLTICPENPEQKVQLDFITFVTQNNIDIMTIYNGDSTAADAFGTFSGVASPGFVQATEENTSGCLTIEFTSNDSGPGEGWSANISCLTPCQTINSQIDTFSPTPNTDGYIRVCPDEDITLTGSGIFSVDGTGATYQWDLGDGNFVDGQTATFSYSEPGVYIVNLNIRDTNTTIDPEGCANTNLINQVVQVGTPTDFTGTAAVDTVICYGESTDIEAVANPVPFINDCTPPVSGTTFLPDGSGAQYETCITVDCFDSNQTLTDPNQLVEVCINIEHSYSGDLDIFIQSPNGQEIRLFDQAGGGTYFGGANDDNSLDPGTGETYCFSMSASTLLANAGTEINGTNPPGNSWIPGTYLPYETFDGLVGSPLNGDWCIRIVDNLSIDNGYIFEWYLNFDPAIQPPELSFTPVIDTEGSDPTITANNGNIITVTPPDAGQYCYTYRVLDDFGCEYTEEVCIDVLPEVVTETPNNLFVCDTGVPPYIFDLESNTDIVLASATNPTDFIVTYHNSMADADGDTAPLTGLNNYSGTDGELIYIRVEYLDSGCYEVLSFTLNVSGQPDINSAPDLELCDDISNDGFEEFDLSVQDAAILGSQPSSEFNVTYHLSFADADAGTGVLPTLYTNTVNPQPIYVRVESAGASDCYNASTNPVFNLIVNDRAIANQPADMVVCDDPSNDGISTFDLSTQEAVILGGQDPAVFNVSFHNTQDDANNNVGALPTTYSNTTPYQETVFVRVEDPANPDCYATTTFDLIINELPNVVTVSPLQVCDDDTDGFMSFILTSKLDEILNGQTGVEVSFHETPVGADMDTAEIFDGYVNTTAYNQTVHIRLLDISTNCYNIGTLDLEVIANPVANTLTPLEQCDDDLDGLVEFDLSQRDAEVLGAQTGLDVTYHGSPEGAEQGTDVLPTLYTNGVPGGEIVYVRIENATSGCYDFTELELVVNPLPTVVTVSNYELCDEVTPGDGQEVFDLSTKDAEVLAGQTDVSLTYYPSQADADASTNAITMPYTNTSSPQQIVVVLTNAVTGCTSQASFDLVVNPLPAFVAPTPLEVCDDATPDGFTEMDLSLKNTEISGNNPGYSVSYYFSMAEAQMGTSPLPTMYTNTSNPQTIYALVEDNTTGCRDITTLELVVEQAPAAFEPQPLIYCDPDNDGAGQFYLTDAEDEITGGATGLEVTYHDTYDNALSGADAIDTTVPFENTFSYTQTIHVRVESETIATDCATIVTLQLIVEDTPQLADPEPLEECDDPSADGYAMFDLTSKAEEVLNGLDPTQYQISYYGTEEGAELGDSPMANPAAYTNGTPNSEVVWIRVEDTMTTAGCYTVVPLELIVNPLPILTMPMPYELCDINDSGDEQEFFTLDDVSAEILNGVPGVTITYYETMDDAQNATGAIEGPYENQSTAQTIFVRGENNDTGCYSTTTLTIRVNPMPTPTPSDQLEDMELCDDINTGDGVELFDLTDYEELILNNEAGVTATYHETLYDADLGQNAITDPTAYENIEMPQQDIYVRVTKDATGCYLVVDFTIRVNPLPEVVAVTDFIQCELNTDGFDSFDLTSKDAEVLNGQDPTRYVVSYHNSLADAEAGTGALVSPYTNTSNPQEIYVTITDTETGCSISTQRFNLQVDEAAQANPNMDDILYELCDDDMETDGDPSNDSTQFDLSTQDAQILDGQDAADYIVSYYASEEDANLNVNPLPNLYENVVNPQVVYARVDNNTMTVTPIALDLSALTTGLDLDANGTVDTYDTDNDGVFDLLDVDGDGNSDGIDANADGLFEYVDIDGDGLGDPVDLDNDGTFDNQEDGSICFAVAPLTLQVNPLPILQLEDSYILCVNTNGTEALDPLVLDTGLSATDYEFVWSYNGEVMVGETGPSIVPSQGGTYEVEVTDLTTSTETSCTNFDSTEVIESEPPTLVAEVVTQAFADNHVIEAVASGTSTYEYSLDGGPWQDSGTFTNVSTGEHVVTARDKNGCGIATADVFVLDYPLYFTPNGDGNHDTWNISGIGGSAKIYIFDRYGKLLKQLSPNGPGWDGTYNGNRMPTSGYWFRVEYDEPLTGQRKEYKAHFTLKR